YQWRVLWRNRYIPAHPPAAPPSTAGRNRTASGIRRIRLRAKVLSSPIMQNAVRFMAASQTAAIGSRSQGMADSFPFGDQTGVFCLAFQSRTIRLKEMPKIMEVVMTA